MCVDLLGVGDMCGELAVLADGEPRTATVTAASELRGLVLTAHFVREVHDRMPAVGAQIERIAAERSAHNARAAR